MIKLYTREAGQGQPMVLLHGNGEDGGYFAQQIAWFSRQYHVIAVDTRGHGGSPRGKGPFTLERFAEDLRDFLRARRLGKVILLGFSDGGNIALLFALKYPQYVDRLILNGANLNPLGMKLPVLAAVAAEYGKACLKLAACAAAGKRGEETKSRGGAAGKRGEETESRRAAAGKRGEETKSRGGVAGKRGEETESRRGAAAADARRRRELNGLMLFEPWIRPQLLERLRMPVLVIAGTEDMIRKSHTEKIAAHIPHSRLLFQKGTHFIAAENPDSFNRSVDAFLLATRGTQLQQMRRLWGRRRAERLDRDKMHHFAVLIPLIFRDGEYQVVFEVRAGALKSQPGEVCFPGGAVEAGESRREAAVRETMEELLLKKRQIEIIGPMDALITPGDAAVWPYLGILRRYRGTFSRDEVDRVFTVPLRWFAQHEPERYQTVVATEPGDDFPYDRIPGGRDYHWRRGRYDVLFYQYGDETIWGMTAKMIHAAAGLYRRQILEKKG